MRFAYIAWLTDLGVEVTPTEFVVIVHQGTLPGRRVRESRLGSTTLRGRVWNGQVDRGRRGTTRGVVEVVVDKTEHVVTTARTAQLAVHRLTRLLMQVSKFLFAQL